MRKPSQISRAILASCFASAFLWPVAGRAYCLDPKYQGGEFENYCKPIKTLVLFGSQTQYGKMVEKECNYPKPGMPVEGGRNYFKECTTRMGNDRKTGPHMLYGSTYLCCVGIRQGVNRDYLVNYCGPIGFGGLEQAIEHNDPALLNRLIPHASAVFNCEAEAIEKCTHASKAQKKSLNGKGIPMCAPSR